MVHHWQITDSGFPTQISRQILENNLLSHSQCYIASLNQHLNKEHKRHAHLSRYKLTQLHGPLSNLLAKKVNNIEERSKSKGATCNKVNNIEERSKSKGATCNK